MINTMLSVNNQRRSFALLLLANLLLTVGCATVTSETDQASSAKTLYQKAKQALDKEDFQLAIEHYENLEIQHPFGPYAQQAQLDIIYSYYRHNETESAVAAADRFIKLNPRHAQVDYAYYLRGLANFGLTRGTFDNWLDRDPAQRDPRSARQSYQYFKELLERFPNSQYQADALQRMIHLRNYLARHELYVADYYIKRGAYIAAAKRGAYVIENFPQTPAATKALAVMAQAYQALGLKELYQDTLKVMQANATTTPSNDNSSS